MSPRRTSPRYLHYVTHERQQMVNTIQTLEHHLAQIRSSLRRAPKTVSLAKLSLLHAESELIKDIDAFLRKIASMDRRYKIQ